MKPSEVIAMRDKLSEWLATEYKDNSDVLAESLIKSGWVVAPPKTEGRETIKDFARVGWNDPCVDGLCPNSCSHRMAECLACGIEWAWGVELSRIEKYVTDHNQRVHGVTAPPKNEGEK